VSSSYYESFLNEDGVYLNIQTEGNSFSIVVSNEEGNEFLKKIKDPKISLSEMIIVEGRCYNLGEKTEMNKTIGFQKITIKQFRLINLEREGQKLYVDQGCFKNLSL